MQGRKQEEGKGSGADNNDGGVRGGKLLFSPGEARVGYGQHASRRNTWGICAFDYLERLTISTGGFGRARYPERAQAVG